MVITFQREYMIPGERIFSAGTTAEVVDGMAVELINHGIAEAVVLPPEQAATDKKKRERR